MYTTLFKDASFFLPMPKPAYTKALAWVSGYAQAA
jgi:hypothetical protein